ncbi:cell wall hydrolase [Sphingomonas alba]|uniref:Cell wall hydrolase n=1 Tax=Sphingomonas alba TaxID=2908208 RepID=A0ABT0RQB1_9SPHN|nr:cell wall hydrolase [Sphingomonas alba]MCL6684790.1 cell wall hydrolase [Sphingomonas alba]
MTVLHIPRTKGMLLSGAGLAFLGTAALTMSSLSEPAVASDSRPISAGKAAALIQATTGDEANKVEAVGEQAKVINAALPFSDAPVLAARAFVLPAGETLDQRRAVLCLTQAVYYEAGFEPIEGRRAVAQVVLNRMRHPAFPKSVCGVVYQHSSTPVCQFTFVCDGSLFRKPEAAAWKQAEQIARAALAGYVERSVGNATHYHADYVAPYWAPMLTKITQLGAHIFYRWPGAWGQPAAFTGHYIGEPRDPVSMRPPVVLAKLTTGDGQPIVQGPITDGTVLHRAPNDVGGLLDTTKGWTLTIPMPNETGSATQRIAASQGTPMPAQATQNDAAAETRVIASR